MKNLCKALVFGVLVSCMPIAQASAKICLAGMCGFFVRDAEVPVEGGERVFKDIADKIGEVDKKGEAVDTDITGEQPAECHDCACYTLLMTDVIKFVREHHGEYQAKYDTNSDGKVNVDAFNIALYNICDSDFQNRCGGRVKDCRKNASNREFRGGHVLRG